MNQKNLVKYLYSYFSLLLILLLFIPLVLFVLNLMPEFSMLFMQNIKKILIDEYSWKVIFNCILLLFISIIIILFVFIFLCIISSITAYLAYRIAADKYSFKQPDLILVFKKSFSWEIYRILYVIKPINTVISIITVFVIVNFLLFNHILFFVSFGFPFFVFISVLFFWCLFIGIVISIFMAIFRIFTSMFGIDSAVSEPDLENFFINKRSSRLLLSNISNAKLVFAYFMFPAIIIIQITGFILSVFSGIIPDIKLLLLLLIIDITYYLGLSFLKSSLYIDSIVKKYEKITFRDKLYLRKIISDL